MVIRKKYTRLQNFAFINYYDERGLTYFILGKCLGSFKYNKEMFVGPIIEHKIVSGPTTPFVLIYQFYSIFYIFLIKSTKMIVEVIM